MWFTETPWPPMLILLVAAMACGWMWAERRQARWAVGLIACVLMIAGVWAFERATVTPREQLEQHVIDLAQAFQDRRQDDFFNFISGRAVDVRAMGNRAFELVTEVHNLRLTEIDVTLLANGSRAKTDFRANGTISVQLLGDIGHHPTRWEMTWQQEGGQWKIIAVQRIDPITGQPMRLTASSQ